MPLILDPDAHPEPVLRAMLDEFVTDLASMRDDVVHPTARVLDPASLDTARELIDAVLARVGRGGERTRADLAADANLAYATMLAVIDLLKSHTDLPRVPPARKGAGASAP